jgi:hypothetical protein
MPIIATHAPLALRAEASRLLLEHGGLENLPAEIGAIPIFTIAPERLFSRTPSRYGRRIGWRFLRLGQTLQDQVDIAIQNHDRWSYRRGSVVSVTCRYGVEAETALAERPVRYVPRILTLPYIHMEALWIHSPKPGARDRYYGLPQEQPSYPDTGFMKEARRRLRSVVGSSARASH